MKQEDVEILKKRNENLELLYSKHVGLINKLATQLNSFANTLPDSTESLLKSCILLRDVTNTMHSGKSNLNLIK